MATPRERVLRVLGGMRPDAVPWFGDLDYWATALIGRGMKPPDFKESGAYIDWHRNLGVGFYLQGYFPFRMIFDGCRVEERREGPDRIRRIATPRGELCERWRWMPESFAEAPVDRLLKTASDLPAYIWLHRHLRYEPEYAFAERRLAQVGETGIVLAYLPKSPLMQMVALDAGICAVVAMKADAPAAFEDALAVVDESHGRAAAIALASPAEALMIPENLSSEVVGPALYEAHMRLYHKTWTARIRAAGKRSFIHLDGTLRGLLGRVASAGFEVVEAMTPSPVGDLGVSGWAAFDPSGKVVFWGGLPGVYFTDLVPDAEFERHVKAVLAVMRREPRYVLGVADQVPPDGLEVRVRRVGDLVEEFGRY